jgi:trigger factor
MMAEARRYPGQEKQVFEYYRSQPDAMQSLRAPIYEDKVIDHIFATAQVTERVLPVKEFIEASRIDDDDEEAGV